MKISRIEGYNGKYGSNPQEIQKFLMISSNLINSDDEWMIEIRENGRFESELKDDSRESKII